MADTPAKPKLLDLANIRFVDDIYLRRKNFSKQRKKVQGLIVQKTLGKEKHPGLPPGDSLASPSKAAELQTCNNSY